MNIINRSGVEVPFDINRIINAIDKALISARLDPLQAGNLALQVSRNLKDTPTIEQIQDEVEKVLELNCPEAGKAYILYRAERAKLREKEPKFSRPNIRTPWGPVGYVTYKRTYSQRLDLSDPNSETEEFHQTCERVCKAVNTQLGCDFTRDELSRLYSYMMNLKGIVAGRFLWQLGMKTVDRLGLMSLQNCAFVAVKDISAFEWMFDCAMLGVGIGFSVAKRHISQLPAVVETPVSITHEFTDDADYIVPDTREGWAGGKNVGGLLKKVIRSYFVNGKSFSYSTKLIRGKGKPIKTFGGIASGPDSLVEGIANICRILDGARGRQITSMEAYDIMCILGDIVVSGNVRRVALIAIGDYDDIDFLRAKRWDLGGIPPWRCRSNNSVYCDDVKKLPEEFWEGYKGNGEPYGLINIELAKRVGRLMDGEAYPDHSIEGFNPCAEQGLADRETCCLAEMFLPNLTSYEEALDVALLLYRVCKHSLNLPCHQKTTETIVHNNQRMGIGITGYLQSTPEQISWLGNIYNELRKFDKAYSNARGYPISVKLTTCKPSGTLSLLAGVTSGCHPAIYRYMIRRMRMATNHKLVQICKEHGCHTEYERRFGGGYDPNTIVVDFPYRFPDHAKLASETSALDQLKIIKDIQTYWSDNSVSCTIYYKLDELPAIRKYLEEHFTDEIKTCSFLLHYDHGFDQAPYEEISKEHYDELVSKFIPITGINVNVMDDSLDGSTECAGGVCPWK